MPKNKYISVVESIVSALGVDQALLITEISNITRLNNSTIKRWIELINFIQNKCPPLEVILFKSGKIGVLIKKREASIPTSEAYRL